MRDLGDKDLEVCLVDFATRDSGLKEPYTYRCTKSLNRTYGHNLQYDIRWKMDIYEFDSPRVKTRQVHKETRTVSRCS
jgi:hypothetical protein